MIDSKSILAQLPVNTLTEIQTSMDGPRRVGLVLLFLIFGVFGIWATIAPLDSNAHATGTVTVKSYKKIVQHLEGGIISEISVKNGDFVSEGQALLTLDNTQPLAQLEIANATFAALATLEARLTAERDNLDAIAYSPELLNSEFDTAIEISAQNQIFQARKTAQKGSVDVLEQRIEQLQSIVLGQKALKISKERLAGSYLEELEDVKALLADGFSDITHLRNAERSHESLRGEAAELTASIASTEIQIGETRLQILQQKNEFRNDVIGQLADTQTRLKDSRERVNALKDVVARTVIRAPVDGVVNGMQFHTVSGVIAPATTIAEIVPQFEDLIIEAKVSPLDIDRVFEGQKAMIRFSTFSSKTVPTLFGSVLSLSADAFIDEFTGMSYYLARIEVSPQGMEDLGNLSLVPGMPAEVFINSGSRTFLQYIYKPLSNSLARSMNED
ncbi:MAG: hemolysin secretion protein D [SAR86 cluster bacterium]|uniref:Membrane fusion protein (MFP) family protein n=1 Tax=SAR86 cluster bacterium TaxID=2030880 RepID=A0A2A5B8U2_9GAMM|nr:MAG: hemolysin secretion protein D [SAR86 cluster bacterium]